VSLREYETIYKKRMSAKRKAEELKREIAEIERLLNGS
jgi:hypothetical protein